MLERKLIAGIPHVRILCGTCDAKIWVAERTFVHSWHPLARRHLRCTDCAPPLRESVEVTRHAGVLVRASDRNYHGGNYAG